MLVAFHLTYHLDTPCRCSKYDWSGENADEPVWTGVSAKKKAPAKKGFTFGKK